MQLSVKHPSVSFFRGFLYVFIVLLCVYLIEVIASNGSDEKIKIYELRAIKVRFFLSSCQQISVKTLFYMNFLFINAVLRCRKLNLTAIRTIYSIEALKTIEKLKLDWSFWCFHWQSLRWVTVKKIHLLPETRTKERKK